MSSKLLSLLVVCLLVGTLFAGSAAAVDSSSDNLPESSEVGTDVQTTFELTELFADSQEWTLHGETNLTDATWTVSEFDQAGNQIRQSTHTGETFNEDINTDDGTTRVEVQIVGTTPEIENLSYDPPDQYTIANFSEVRPGGTEHAIASHTVRHHTQDSKEAREAIDSARDSVEESGSSDGQQSLDSAISAYENGNFGNAITNAERAENEGSQSQLLLDVALFGGAAVLVLLLVGGGYYVYKSRQQGPSRLR